MNVSLRPSQLRPVTPRSTPLIRRAGELPAKSGSIVSAGKSPASFQLAHADGAAVLPACHSPIACADGLVRWSVGESILPLKDCSGDPDGPMPDVASSSLSAVTVAPVATVIVCCAPTLPSRRLRSIDASPLPSVTNIEYQCLATIASGMVTSVWSFARSASPPDRITSVMSPSDQIV